MTSGAIEAWARDVGMTFATRCSDLGAAGAEASVLSIVWVTVMRRRTSSCGTSVRQHKPVSTRASQTARPPRERDCLAATVRRLRLIVQRRVALTPYAQTSYRDRMKRLVGAALSLLACTEDQPPLRAAAVEAGGDFSCALLTDSTVACWGGNTRGQLGRGTYDDAPVTERAVVAGLAGVLQIAAGTSHACARLRDGTVRCSHLLTAPA